MGFLSVSRKLVMEAQKPDACKAEAKPDVPDTNWVSCIQAVLAVEP